MEVVEFAKWSKFGWVSLKDYIFVHSYIFISMLILNNEVIFFKIMPSVSLKVICKTCNHIRDLDLCRDPYLSQDNGDAV